MLGRLLVAIGAGSLVTACGGKSTPVSTVALDTEEADGTSATPDPVAPPVDEQVASNAQLLALGAPASLVRDAQQAGLDEIGHAEHAFSITSRLAGRAIGPGKLPELDAPLETDLFAVARAALVEGCIGETLAAAMALEQAQQAGDVAIPKTLLAVAEDETRHAELAFRFVVWCLAQGGRPLREALRREVDRRLVLLPEPPSTSGLSAGVLHHYGRLTANEQQALYRQARDQLLRPTFAALFDVALARPAEAELHA